MPPSLGTLPVARCSFREPLRSDVSRSMPVKLGVLLSTILVVLLTACLPSEPDTPVRIDFQLTDPLLVITVGGEVQPSVVVLADSVELPNARYRLETLDTSVVAVDSTRHAVRGMSRDTTTVRVVFLTAASGEVIPDTTFRVRVVPAGVTVTPALDTLEEIGATIQLTATALDAAGVGLTEAVSFNWSSSDEAVATVSATGLVTAVDEGGVTISAEVDGVTGVAMLTVIQVVTDVQVQPTADTLYAVGRTTQFTALAWRNDVDLTQAKFSWTSSDTFVAVVDADGVATAVSEGTTEIVATAGGVADTVLLLVDQIAQFVFVSPGAAVVAVNDTVRLNASAKDSANATIPNQVFSWQSDNTDVATVDAGLVSTYTTGSVSITATAVGVPNSVTVDVLVPASVNVTPAQTTLPRWGDTLALAAIVRGAGGTVIDAVTINWSSSSETIAMVNASGVVTAVGSGAATITATASGGASGSASVTVMQEAVDSVVVSRPGMGRSTEDAPDTLFSAIPYNVDGDSADANIYWSSLNTNIAKVDSVTGVVTAVGCGQVTIAARAADKVGYALLTVQDPTLLPVATWEPPDTLEEAVLSIWGTSSTDVWASGRYSYLWHYDGNFWSVVATGLGFSDLWGTSSSDIWATWREAESGDLWHFDGAAWSVDTTFPGLFLTDVWGTSPADVWVSAYDSVDGGYGLRYDGENWATQQTSSGSVGRLGWSVWGTSIHDVWLSGASRYEVLHFRGGSWGSETLQYRGQSQSSIWGTTRDDVWRLQGDSEWIVGHWVGTWSYETVADSGQRMVASIGGAAPHDVYFATSGGRLGVLKIRRWNGSGFTTVHTLPGLIPWRGAIWTAPDDGSVWIGGTGGAANLEVPGFILRGKR